MSADHVIKLWDLRNNRCMQTIVEKSWPQQSEAHPSVMAYEPRRRRVVTATHQPFFWKHMCCADDQQGHSQPLVAVLYSPEFHLVCTLNADVLSSWGLTQKPLTEMISGSTISCRSDPGIAARGE